MAGHRAGTSKSPASQSLPALSLPCVQGLGQWSWMVAAAWASYHALGRKQGQRLRGRSCPAGLGPPPSARGMQSSVLGAGRSACLGEGAAQGEETRAWGLWDVKPLGGRRTVRTYSELDSTHPAGKREASPPLWSKGEGPLGKSPGSLSSPHSPSHERSAPGLWPPVPSLHFLLPPQP